MAAPEGPSARARPRAGGGPRHNWPGAQRPGHGGGGRQGGQTGPRDWGGRGQDDGMWPGGRDGEEGEEHGPGALQRPRGAGRSPRPPAGGSRGAAGPNGCRPTGLCPAGAPGCGREAGRAQALSTHGGPGQEHSHGSLNQLRLLPPQQKRHVHQSGHGGLADPAGTGRACGDRLKVTGDQPRGTGALRRPNRGLQGDASLTRRGRRAASPWQAGPPHNAPRSRSQAQHLEARPQPRCLQGQPWPPTAVEPRPLLLTGGHSAGRPPLLPGASWPGPLATLSDLAQPPTNTAQS